jgi:protein-tyrosine phosphatase
MAAPNPPTRTSLTHPIYVDWLPDIAPGAIGLTFAPGKKAPSAIGHYRWERDLALDMARLVDEYAVTRLACLIEDHEFEALGIADYLDQAAQRGVAVYRHPIADGGTPDSPQSVQSLVERIVADARSGEVVVVHCRGGLGRAGTISGCALVSLGLAPEDALDVLRRTRGPQCPENLGQVDFIRRYAELNR